MRVRVCVKKAKKKEKRKKIFLLKERKALRKGSEYKPVRAVVFESHSLGPTTVETRALLSSSSLSFSHQWCPLAISLCGKGNKKEVKKKNNNRIKSFRVDFLSCCCFRFQFSFFPRRKHT
jgi:hypothetical protein